MARECPAYRLANSVMLCGVTCPENAGVEKHTRVLSLQQPIGRTMYMISSSTGGLPQSTTQLCVATQESCIHRQIETLDHAMPEVKSQTVTIVQTHVMSRHVASTSDNATV
jgi:hypothetical protein